MSYVIYARKSSESEDRQVLSIDSQIQELKDLALRHRVEVADVLTEARSAKAPGRPVFGNMMRRVRHGSIRGILCWKMDRLARNPYDAGLVLQAQLDGQLERIMTSDGIKTSDGNDRLLGTFEFALATKFIDDLRANVKRGNRARFLLGWPNFRPPAGYVEQRVDGMTIVVKDPERFPLIRRAWDMVLTGTTRPTQVLAILNADWGFRSREVKAAGNAPMSVSAFYRLLGNPFYKGIIQLANGETYKGKHEPMVSPEEFARVQEILGRKARPRPIEHDFVFAGLLHCATCGRALVGEEHVKPNGKRYVYYRCHRPRPGGRCPEPTLPERTLRDQLVADLKRMQLSAEAADWIRDNLGRALESEMTELQATRESLEKAIDQATKEEDALISLRVRGAIDDATFDRRRAVLMDRKAHLDLKRERPLASPADLLAKLDRALTFSQHAPEVFANGSAVQQRQIVEAVGSNYRVTGRKALYTAKKPFSFFKESAGSSPWCTIVEDVRTWLRDSEGLWLPDLGSPLAPATMPRMGETA
jgi:DNA invertase Pin-like site-specific DNA recombinase